METELYFILGILVTFSLLVWIVVMYKTDNSVKKFIRDMESAKNCNK